MSNNWFNAAAIGNPQSSSLSSSSSLFNQPQQQSQQPQQQQPSSSLLFGGSSVSSPTASQQNFGFHSVNGGGGARGESIPQSDLVESQSLQKRYLESFTPGSKKKGGAAKTSSSPTGPSSFTEPSRFGSNSLYGSGAGVSPSKTPHRLSRPPISQSSSSPLTSSVRSRLSVGGTSSGGGGGSGFSGTGGSGTGSMYGGGDRMDEDRPPTESYADLEGMGRMGELRGGVGLGGGMGGDDEMGDGFERDDPTPTDMLMVYGLPSSKQDRLQSLLSSFGSLTQFHPGPSDSNYVVVAFDDPAVGLRLERQSGELRLDGCYLGVKRVAGGSGGMVPDAWMKQGGAGESAPNQNDRAVVRNPSQGGRNHNLGQQNDEPNGSSSSTSISMSNPSSDPFANISTLTPIKSGTGSVFRPQVSSSSVSQPVIPAGYSFGTVSSGQGQQQSQQQQQARLGLFGRLSDVMFGQ